jgi:hypothetical protein
MVYWIMLRLLAPVAISLLFLARADTQDVRAFETAWVDQEVYLLIPAAQGEKKGLLRKTTHLEFFTGSFDAYPRSVTLENGEIWFELFSIKSVKCKPEHYEIRITRPSYPLESFFGTNVSLILDIRRGELPLTPEIANDILASVMIEKNEFPRVLWIGEGPYQQASLEINLSWLRYVAQIHPGMNADELTSHLGEPLDVRTVQIGDQSYRYWWYFGYRFFVITKGSEVMDSRILYF